MAIAKARPGRAAPEAKTDGEEKPKEKHLVQKSGAFNCVLHRNSPSAYRAAGRPVLEATGLYDNPDSIRAGVENQRSVKRLRGAERDATVAAKMKLYTFNHSNATKNGVFKNFQVGYLPYGNQAHHILPCELFYQKGWDEDTLRVVRQSLYDINNGHNIIYLPLSERSAQYHDLPNHADGHDKYNKKLVARHLDPLLEKVKEAMKETPCKPEKLVDVRNELISIEDRCWKFLTTPGRRSMA